VDERELKEALRDLPRIVPSGPFADSVLRRIREDAREAKPRPWRGPLLIAAVAIAAAGVARERERRQARALENETRAIAREIEGMKRTLPSPMIDLGQRDGVRYVLDLRRVPAARGGIL
jgi:hypothetical protein